MVLRIRLSVAWRLVSSVTTAGKAEGWLQATPEHHDGSDGGSGIEGDGENQSNGCGWLFRGMTARHGEVALLVMRDVWPGVAPGQMLCALLKGE